MTYLDLIRTTQWPDVKAALLWLYPDDKGSIRQYQRVFQDLRQLAPVPNPMRIFVQTTFREGLDTEPFQEVIGRDGSINRDLEDFKYSGEAPDSEYALRQTEYSLCLRPWDVWLGMEIDEETLNRIPSPQVVAHCLWEMTFHGFVQADVRDISDELKRRAEELDAMTDEERERLLVPADEVFQRVRSQLEKPE